MLVIDNDMGIVMIAGPGKSIKAGGKPLIFVYHIGKIGSFLTVKVNLILGSFSFFTQGFSKKAGQFQ